MSRMTKSAPITPAVDVDTANASYAFRKLRILWFKEHLESRIPPGARYSSEEYQSAVSKNAELFNNFNYQTEEILKGKNYKIDPRCAEDLEREKK